MPPLHHEAVALFKDFILFFVPQIAVCVAAFSVVGATGVAYSHGVGSCYWQLDIDIYYGDIRIYIFFFHNSCPPFVYLMIIFLPFAMYRPLVGAATR